MQFFYQKMERFVHDDRFVKLVEHIQGPQAPTLRQLKAAFPDPGFEKFLDKLIEHELIVRKDRRYYLGFPIYSQKEIQAQQEQLETSRFFGETDTNQLLLSIYEQIKKKTYFFAVGDGIRLPAFYQAGNKTLQFYTVSYQNTSETSLPIYFANNRNGEEDLNDPQLQQMIGDVNEEYFFDQVAVILEKIPNKRIRRSIFLEALLETKMIKPQDTSYQLLIPVIPEKAETAFPEVESLSVLQLFLLADLLLSKQELQQINFLVLSPISEG